MDFSIIPVLFEVIFKFCPGLFFKVFIIFINSRQHPKQIAAFQLLYLISTRLSDTTTSLWCPSFVADHFLELGQVEAANHVLSRMEKCVSKLSPDDVERNLFAYVHFMTTRCQVFFAQESVGYNLLIMN